MVASDFDEDGVREVASVAASERARRAKEQSVKSVQREQQDALRADFDAGKMTMADYAKAAREAGIGAREVGAALQERAAAEKRMEQKRGKAEAAAESASADEQQPSELTAALAAKANGLERLKRGEVADAAEAFEDAASLGAQAAAALADGADAAPSRAVRLSSLLNASLCYNKLEEWSSAEAVCHKVLALEPSSAKALYRRGNARLGLRNPIDAVKDLEAALALTPADKDVQKRLGEAKKALGYRGTPFHRIVKGFVVQGGDVVSGNGAGGVSAQPDRLPFADESFVVPHARPGMLSMANMGEPNTNGCQFFLTLAAAPECDQKHVAFGRLIGGLPLLRRLEALPVDGADHPLEKVLIADCGELDRPSAENLLAADADADGQPDASQAGVGGGVDLGGEALLHAAREGDLNLMRELIGRGVPVDAFGTIPRPDDVLDLPALAAAAADAAAADGGASGGGGAAAAAAAGEGEEESEPAQIDCAALAVAAAHDHIDMLRGLLDSKADPALMDSTSRAPLHWASLAGSARCVSALLAAKADVGVIDGSGRTAAHLACAKGHLEVLEALMEASSAPAPPASSGAASGSSSIKHASIKHAVANGLTPLHIAAAADFAEGVTLLCEEPADANVLAVGELSPTHLAAARGSLGALSALLAAGADATLAAERSKRQPLHAACEHGRALAVGALLAARADVHATDAHGGRPLHWACKAGAADAVSVLLGAKADVRARTTDGSAPLHLACEAAAPIVVSALIRAKADVGTADGHGVEPLHAASAVGSAQSVKHLLTAGANVHATLSIAATHQISSLRQTYCKTALYLASEHGHVAVCRALLAKGADANALATIQTEQSLSQTSPLWAARRGGHDDVVTVLVAAGATETAETVAESADALPAADEGGEPVPKIPVLI